MQGVLLQLDHRDGRYIPGEPITGYLAWDLNNAARRIEIRLLWQTSGKGTQDTGVVGEIVWENESTRGERPFAFEAVDGPYSFSGRLITVAWRVEARVDPGGHDAQAELTLSPTGQEVRP